jgi:hypothetical protein
MWFKPLSTYQPFSLRQITVLRVMISVFILLLIILWLQLPLGSALVCIAPLMLIAQNPVAVRGLQWQLSVGFGFGVLFSLIVVDLLGNSWISLYVFSFIWAGIWLYLGELHQNILMACRIISVLPIIFFNMVCSGVTDITPTVVLLLLMACSGVWLCKLVELLTFPLLILGKQPINVFGPTPGATLHAIQFALSIVIVLATNQWFEIPGDGAIVTALVSITVVSTSISKQLQSSIAKRIAGNLLGALIALVCLYLINTFPFAWFMVTLVCLCFGAFAYWMMCNMKYTSLGWLCFYRG